MGSMIREVQQVAYGSLTLPRPPKNEGNRSRQRSRRGVSHAAKSASTVSGAPGALLGPGIGAMGIESGRTRLAGACPLTSLRLRVLRCGGVEYCLAGP